MVCRGPVPKHDSRTQSLRARHAFCSSCLLPSNSFYPSRLALGLWLGDQKPYLSTKQLFLSKQQSPRVSRWEKHWKLCWMQKPMSKRIKNRNRRAIIYVDSNSAYFICYSALCTSLITLSCRFTAFFYLFTVSLCCSLSFSCHAMPYHAVLSFTLISIPFSTLLLLQCHEYANHISPQSS